MMINSFPLYSHLKTVPSLDIEPLAPDLDLEASGHIEVPAALLVGGISAGVAGRLYGGLVIDMVNIRMPHMAQAG